MVGLSKDPVEHHRRFREKHGLGMGFAGRRERLCLRALGMWMEKSMYGCRYMGIERATFLVLRNHSVYESPVCISDVDHGSALRYRADWSNVMSMKAMDRPLRDSRSQKWHGDIQRILRQRYDRPLINNVDRGAYVECMLAKALNATIPWQRGDDWESWDLELGEKPKILKIEVKQAAARQSWDKDSKDSEIPTRSPRFNIAKKRTLSPEGKWTKEPPKRHAHVWIFCWHSEKDKDAADHRCLEQWEFYIVATARLPDKKMIGLQGLKDLGASPVLIGAVKEALQKEIGTSPKR